MSVGEVIFNAADGYQEDMWDDSELIRNYDRALEASRELMKRRSEGYRKKKEWTLGDPCRVTSASDGLEYEGTIVKLSARKAIVRILGYNEELEVLTAQLEETLGAEEVQMQIQEAKIDEELYHEEPFIGDLNEGEFCRARWSLDDLVYEATILSVDVEKQRVRVRFIGYENEDTVSLENVYASKGEDWRQQQEEEASHEADDRDIADTFSKLMEENSHVFSKIHEMPGLSNLSFDECDKPKVRKEKSKHKKEKRKSKSDHSSSKTDKESGIVPPPPVGVDQFQLPLPQSSDDWTPAPLQDPTLPTFPNLTAQEPAGLAGMVPPPPMPPLPSFNRKIEESNEVLHSMLLSWYMAGYHTGYYQAVANRPKKHKEKSKKT